MLHADPFPLKFLSACPSGRLYPSARVRDILVEAGLPIQHARIIYGGTDMERFPDVRVRNDLTGHLKLLYAGQVARHKGVHTAIEAMASGLVVVGTTTGGTKEILGEGVTGLTFAPEDEDGLAEQVSRLITNPDLCCRLAQAGRQTVMENFTLDKMVQEIEAYLVDCFVRSSGD